jgi:nucleotide-binding universal stress UspA family protein
MYKRLLVGCDGSEGSQLAALQAAILAKRLGAKLDALWVHGSLPHYPETIDEIEEDQESAHAFFENIKDRLRSVEIERDVAIQPEMRSGHPAQQIVEFACTHDTDLIVLGNRGHSRLWGELVGHTTDRVSEHAPCSVLIVRSRNESACYDKILVGYDGSPTSETALRHALALSQKVGFAVHVLWVSEGTRAGKEEATDAEKTARAFFNNVLRERIQAAATEQGIEVVADFHCGNAAKMLIEQAWSGGFRLIVLGDRGHSDLWGKLLGGVADRVSHLARCDVLIVRA